MNTKTKQTTKKNQTHTTRQDRTPKARTHGKQSPAPPAFHEQECIATRMFR